MSIQDSGFGIQGEAGTTQASPFRSTPTSPNPESRILNPDDLHFLAHAIRLGARGLGRTWPNPSVGCVLVKDNHVLAAACTADGGRPHAESLALAAAGAHAKGATAYVSLEPCAHLGHTGPCAQALIDAGVTRVVIAAIDPDPRVSGQGIAMLQAAGIEVRIQDSGFGIQGEAETTQASSSGSASTSLNPESRILNPTLRGFFRRVNDGIPHAAMKLATSLDGKITDAHGTSKWITRPAARQHVHRLRAQYDAIITGIGTVLADDPELNVRLPGLHHPHGVRVICDRRLRTPLTSKLVRTANIQPVWVLTSADAVEQAASHATELREAGVVLHVVEDIHLSPLTILRTLGAAGLTRVMIEAGHELSTAFWASGLVETLHWYRAPLMLGEGGKAAIAAFDSVLADTPRLTPTLQMALGDDQYTCYESPPCSPD